MVGLGLIGGSFAKAYADAGVKVYGADIDERSLAAAMAEGCVTGVLDETTVAACDSIIVALYPQDTIEWVARMAPHIAPDALVVDCGGVKRPICSACFDTAERHGFVFLGGHPMAGTHKSGFRAARADLFAGQPMVLVAPPVYDPALISRAQQALIPAGFGSFSVTTPEMHDKIDRLHLAARARGELGVHQKPHGAEASGVFGGKLQRPHARGRAECGHVDGAFPR